MFRSDDAKHGQSHGSFVNNISLREPNAAITISPPPPPRESITAESVLIALWASLGYSGDVAISAGHLISIEDATNQLQSGQIIMIDNPEKPSAKDVQNG